MCHPERSETESKFCSARAKPRSEATKGSIKDQRKMLVDPNASALPSLWSGSTPKNIPRMFFSAQGDTRGRTRRGALGAPAGVQRTPLRDGEILRFERRSDKTMDLLVGRGLAPAVLKPHLNRRHQGAALRGTVPTISAGSKLNQPFFSAQGGTSGRSMNAPTGSLVFRNANGVPSKRKNLL